MGMSDRQFDTYQSKVLMLLMEAKEELAAKGERSQKLDKLIAEIETDLKRP